MNSKKNYIICFLFLIALINFVSSQATEKQDITLYESNGVKLTQTPATQELEPAYKCKFLTDLNFYDLTPLAKLGTFTFNGINQHFNISFNLCNDITDMSRRCKEDEAAMAVARSMNDFDGKTECFKLGGSGSQNQIDHFILDKEENNGIKIHMGGSQTPCDDWRDFDLTVDIICNINAL